MSGIYMHVKKVQEAGYKPALMGLAYNKKQSPEKMSVVAEKPADKDGGHNSCLISLHLPNR